MGVEKKNKKKQRFLSNKCKKLRCRNENFCPVLLDYDPEFVILTGSKSLRLSPASLSIGAVEEFSGCE